MNLAMWLKPSAGLVIRNKEVELLVMQGRKVTSCLRVPIEGKEDAHLVQAIQKVVATSGLTLNKLAVSIQNRDVLFRFFTMPMVPKPEWDTAVQFEARKYNPFKTESLIWDYRAMRIEASNQLDVIFSAIPKESFQRMQDVFAAAGIQPAIVEPRSLSLARLVESAKGAPANEYTCVVDVEQDTAHLAIVKNRVPYLTRDVNLLSSVAPAAAGPEAVEGTASAEAAAEHAEAAEPRAQRLLSELSVSMGFFLREYPSTTIPRVLLCGDERLIGPWCRWLSDQLHCTVELGVPLLKHRVQGGLPLSFASAVGLLQAMQEPSGTSIDFLKRALTKAPSAERGSGVMDSEAVAGLVESLKTPRAVMSMAMVVGFLAICWVGSSMMRSGEQRELNQVM